MLFRSRREWADPSTEFDHRGPDERRHVEPGDPPPAQDQQAAEDNEQDVRQVEEDDEVGEESGECRHQDVNGHERVARSGTRVERKGLQPSHRNGSDTLPCRWQ